MVKIAQKIDSEGLQEKKLKQKVPQEKKINQEVHQEKKNGTRGSLVKKNPWGGGEGSSAKIEKNKVK